MQCHLIQFRRLNFKIFPLDPIISPSLWSLEKPASFQFRCIIEIKSKPSHSTKGNHTIRTQSLMFDTHFSIMIQFKHSIIVPHRNRSTKDKILIKICSLDSFVIFMTSCFTWSKYCLVASLHRVNIICNCRNSNKSQNYPSLVYISLYVTKFHVIRIGCDDHFSLAFDLKRRKQV